MGVLSLAVLLVATIDPMELEPWSWQEAAKISAHDAAGGDLFGACVSVSGTTALVGAYYDDDAGSKSGSAYVYERSGSVWTQQAKLSASDAQAGDLFGFALALEGDTALVGAPGKDAACPADPDCDSGCVYVFVRTGSSWSQQAALTPSDAEQNDAFGSAVDLFGARALIGAPGDGGTGAAYVFANDASDWSEQAKLVAHDRAEGDAFGSCVSLGADTALVGARSDAHSGHTLVGAAYVYTFEDPTWSQQAKLTANDAASTDYFGSALSLDADTALVGAPGKGTSGSAYFFQRTGGSWSQLRKLAASDASPGAYFGSALALDGVKAVVGARYDDGGSTSSGSAWVFERGATGWAEGGRLVAGDAEAQDQFGIAVALDAATVLIGAWGDDDSGSGAGSAYLFAGRPGVRPGGGAARTDGRRRLSALSGGAPGAQALRNAGTNPLSLSAGALPQLGSTLLVTVDLGGTSGHEQAWILGSLEPRNTTLRGGQTLLVDLAEARGGLLHQPLRPGPLATFRIPIPDQPELAGLGLHLQAVHLGAGEPFLLSNALDLILGD